MRTPALLCFVLLALGGCHRSGLGEGALAPSAVSTGAELVPEEAAQARAPEAPGEPVEFKWRSGLDASKGRIQATLPDGRVFKGNYAQVRTVDSEAVGAYYGLPRDPSWVGAAAWADPPERLVTTYTDGALASLESADGTRMRCAFQLRKPARGMAGGGRGDCQLSDQEAVVHARLSKD